MIRNILSTILSVVLTSTISAQVAKTQVLSLSVKPVSEGFELNWPDNATRTGNYQFFYRDLDVPNGTWQSTGDVVKGPASSYLFKTDKNVEFAAQYLNPNNQAESIGYIAAGVVDYPIFKGRTILMIDSLISAELQNEIQQLREDLLASGWFSNILTIKRSEKPESIKAKIKALIDGGNFKTNTLYILGHVPVPYSGYFSSTGSRPPPDGHVEGSGNHTGAWPADVFYSDFEGIWEDLLVKCTTGNQSRHHNIGGDGKYDPSELPGTASLDIGRVDFFDMPAFAESEVELTREYLQRVHNWKTGKIPFVKRALIDNNFNGLNLASTGYHNFSCLIEKDSIFDNRDYFTAQSKGNYLWSYGCGAGSYTSCNGIGNTNNFVSYKKKDSFHNIFTILAGSYFGDWDSKNNLLRASLASGSLATFWGGIPKWYIHHMGLGKHIGHGARITQNNSTEYFNGNFNAAYRGVHIALLGDPTLEMLPIKPVENLLAESQNGTVLLKWSPSPDATSYEVYRIDTVNKQYVSVSKSGDCQALVVDTFFVDECNWSSGDYIYAVAASKESQTPSGIYNNRSMLKMTSVQHSNSLTNSTTTANSFYPNPTQGKIHLNFTGINYGTLRVFDLSGRIILTNDNVDFNAEISLKGLNMGVYLFNAEDKKSGTSFNSWVIISQ